jgi:hypothetical protein
MMMLANQSPDPTAVGAVSSARSACAPDHQLAVKFRSFCHSVKTNFPSGLPSTA